MNNEGRILSKQEVVDMIIPLLSKTGNYELTYIWNNLREVTEGCDGMMLLNDNGQIVLVEE